MPCEACGRTHRTGEGLAKCAARFARKAARESKLLADEARRVVNEANEPAPLYIRRRLREGARWVNIAAELAREYPPPDHHDRWDPIAVIGLHSQTLAWGTEVAWRHRPIVTSDELKSPPQTWPGQPVLDEWLACQLVMGALGAQDTTEPDAWSVVRQAMGQQVLTLDDGENEWET